MIKILLAQVSLPPMSRLSSLGKQSLQSPLLLATVADDLLKPSNDHTGQLARGDVLPPPNTRVACISSHPKTAAEARRQWTANV